MGQGSVFIMPKLETFLQGDVAEAGDDLFEAVQVVQGQKFVAVGEDGLYATYQGLVAGRSSKGVEPEQTVNAATEAIHLRLQQVQIAPFPAIADYDRSGPPTQDAARPLIVETSQ